MGKEFSFGFEDAAETACAEDTLDEVVCTMGRNEERLCVILVFMFIIQPVVKPYILRYISKISV